MSAAHGLIARDDPGVLCALSRCWSEFAATGDQAGQLCCAAAACEAMHVQRRDFSGYAEWRDRLQGAMAGGWLPLDPAWELRALTGVAWTAQIAPLHGVSNAFVVRRIDELLLAAANGADARDSSKASRDVLLAAAAAAVMIHGQEERVAEIEVAVARAGSLIDGASDAVRVRWLHAAGAALTFNVAGPRGPRMLEDARSLAAGARLQAALFDVCHDEVFIRLGREGPAALGPLFAELERALDRTRLYDVARHYHLQTRRLLYDPSASVHAQESAHTALELLESSGYPTSDAAMLYTTFAYAQARRGEIQPALAAMERVARVSTGAQQRQQQSIALFLRAYAMLQSEPLEHARPLLEQAFGEANRMHWFGFRPVPEVASRLAEAALRLQIETEYVRWVIGLRRLEPSGYSAAWPWSVRITTLGRFDVRVGDKPLLSGGKIPHRTLDLLKYLAGSAALSASADKLTASLWPDLEGDLARGAFRTTLHRLRKLLDDPQVIQFDGTTVRLDSTRAWVDALAFDRQVEAIEHALRIGDSVRAQFEGAEAVALYQGHFLGTDDDTPWMLVPRERLSSRFARLIEMLGEHHERIGDRMQARRLYMKGIEIDPLAEDTARRLMTLLREAGEHSEALEVYRALRRHLSVVLGQPPSPQTQRVLETLRTS